MNIAGKSHWMKFIALSLAVTAAVAFLFIPVMSLQAASGVKTPAASVPTQGKHQLLLPFSEGKADYWTCTVSDTSILQETADAFVQSPQPAEAMNSIEGVGIRYFQFTAKKPGTVKIELNDMSLDGKTKQSMIWIIVDVDKNMKVNWFFSYMESNIPVS